MVPVHYTLVTAWQTSLARPASSLLTSGLMNFTRPNSQNGFPGHILFAAWKSEIVDGGYCSVAFRFKYPKQQIS